MSRWLLGRVVLMAALVCLVASRGAVAQGDAQLLVAAQVTADPFVIVWSDSADGTSLDDAAASAFVKQYASTDWGFFDDNTLLIGKNAQPLPVPIFLYISNQDQTFFLVHRHVANFSVDGTVIRDAQTKQGVAVLFFTIPSDDGKVIRTAYMQVRLLFTK